jgi:polar amino acid transport system permease protein
MLWQNIVSITPILLQGTLVSLEIFALTLLLAIPFGLPITLGSISKVPPLRWLCKFYIWVFRGTPLMLQLFFFYFFLPIFFGIRMDSFTTAIVTFVLNYSAYLAEIYRGGIESIDKGQWEAARALGLSRQRTLFGIILPQTVKRVLPSVSNEAITLVKDTALVYVIGVPELMKNAKSIVNRDVNALAYFIAAVIYLVLTAAMTWLSRYMEKRSSVYEGKEAA